MKTTITTMAAAMTLLFTPTAFSQQGSCWIIEGLQGTSYLQADYFKPSTSTIDTPIKLILNGDDSTINTPDMRVQQVDELMALVYSASYSATNFEVIQIDPSAGLALFTKNMNVKGSLSGITGITAMVGPARRCE